MTDADDDTDDGTEGAVSSDPGEEHPRTKTQPVTNAETRLRTKIEGIIRSSKA